jgi:hypothetical protein
MKKYIRWLFLIGFLIFATIIKSANMLYLNQNMFIVLWLLASFIVVLGVIYFRDNETTGEPNPAELSAELGAAEQDTTNKI